jgi:hypothetical protein
METRSIGLCTRKHGRNFSIISIAHCLLYAPLPALAGPPFLTDDPEPVEHKHSEFYIASSQIKTIDGSF